jgi:formylglycine-generating enzyme required for sulfatase activity
MSEFEDQIKQASSQQKTRWLITSMSISLLLLLIGLYIFSLAVYTIQIEPLEADEVSMQSIGTGFGLSYKQKVFTFSDKTSLRVSATGFKDKELVLKSHVKDGVVVFNLEPKLAMVSLHTEPVTTLDWYIDGRFIDRASSLQQELDPGEYTFSLQSDYYQMIDDRISVKAGRDVDYVYELSPLTGTLMINADVSSARLTIDSVPYKLGSTLTQQAAEYAVEVSAPGYYSIQEDISLDKRNLAIERHYKLPPKPIALTLNLQPKGGVLLANGLQIKPADAIQLPYQRQFTFEYSKPGYVSQALKRSFQPEEQFNLDISLAEQKAAVSIDANVESDIYIQGQRIASTPATLQLLTKAQTIELRKTGYRSVQKIITPNVEQLTKLQIMMYTEAQARLVEAKSVYINSVGVEFQLIKPQGQQFTMGGSRDELGQRANEFQRKVRLERPFYVASTELTQRQFSAHNTNSSQPLVNTAWEKVAMFCNQLSRQEGLQPFYLFQGNKYIGFESKANGYRMITEAEWEFMARIYQRDKKTMFAWGDQDQVPAEVGNLADAESQLTRYIPRYKDGVSGLANVRSYAIELSGLFDQIGNASEWVHDIYDLTPPDRQAVYVDPLGLLRGNNHVIKGSSYLSASKTEVRAAFRDGSASPRPELGFRLARYL